jgi:bleomycin hydrolase
MRIFFYLFLSFLCAIVFGEETGKKISENSAKNLAGVQLIKEIPTTPVKDQFETGTCWSFSGLSLIESELMRLGKGTYDLSELYVVRCNYLRKAERYIRMHGKANFSVGGEANDVSQVIDLFGIVPEEAYPGYDKNIALREDEQMDKELKLYIDSIVLNAENYLHTNWETGYQAILDKYMGPVPAQFSFEKKTFTPNTFAAALGIPSKDFELISSFIHEPFYKPFILEVPDNWSWEKSMNVPLNELVEIIDSALYSGFSVAWAMDISERGFCFKKGMACLPAKVYQTDTVISEDTISRCSTSSINFDFRNPEHEIMVTEKMRQEAFDNFTTTDDHLMHIIGTAIGVDGKKYFYIKNSWGTENQFDGYMFVSESYFRYKTISIMVNRNAIPFSISSKFIFN